MDDTKTPAEWLAEMVASRRQLHALAGQRRQLLLAKRLVPAALFEAMSEERQRLVTLKTEVAAHADV